MHQRWKPVLRWVCACGRISRPQPRSISQASRPHLALRHEQTAAPLSSGPLDRRPEPWPLVSDRPTRSASTEPTSNSAGKVRSGLAGPASTDWILLNNLCCSSCITRSVRGLRGIAPCIHTVHHCPVLQVRPCLFDIHRSTRRRRGRLASRAPSGPIACLQKLQAGRPQQAAYA